ncbi:MAG: hypothetical protein ABSA72_10165, partial [Nitrososphaerales archaeon]
MAILPIVPGSEVQTPASGTRMDPTAFRNAALARGRVGEALGSNVGDLFQTLATKIQDARNAKKVFDADQLMQQTHDQFVTDIQKDPALASDPDTWVPEYNRRVKGTVDQIMSDPKLGPAAKRQLNMMTKNWALTSTTTVQFEALKRETGDIQQSGERTMMLAAQRGDEDKYFAAVRALGQRGIYGPATVRQKLSEWPSINADFRMTSIIIGNPTHAPDMIQPFAKDVTPEEFSKKMKEAHAAQNSAWTENLNDARQDLDNGQKVDIDKLEKDGTISARGAATLRNVIKRQTEEGAKEYAKIAKQEAGRVREWANRYDPNKDPSHSEFEALSAEVDGLDLAYKNELLPKLKKLDPSDPKNLHPPSAEPGKSYLGDMLHQGMLGDITVDKGQANDPA